MKARLVDQSEKTEENEENVKPEKITRTSSPIRSPEVIDKISSKSSKKTSTKSGSPGGKSTKTSKKNSPTISRAKEENSILEKSKQSRLSDHRSPIDDPEMC